METKDKMDSRLLYYDAIDEFHQIFNKDLLTTEHLIGGQIKISSLHYPNSEVDDTANFWGYELQKDGQKYLLASTDDKDKEINLRNILPILPVSTQKVASKGVVYQQIMEYKIARIKPQQHFTPKEFINILTPFDVTNKKHYVLNTLKAITSLMFRYNDRTCSNPGFGKDSAVDLLGNLIGGCETIVSPTYAKLEERAVILKWLAINEVVDITTADWRIIQQYLLDFGAFKNKVTKHSKAHGIVKEVIDASEFSLGLLYNDIADYPEPRKYFDFITKNPVKDRFPAFRLYGSYLEDFNSLRGISVKELVAQNMDFYKSIISTFEYYRQNINNHLHKYTPTLKDYGNRWNINLGRLLAVVDLFSETEQEYNDWVVIIENSLDDYKEMLEYPTMVRNLAKKFDIPKTAYDEFNKLECIITHIRQLDPDGRMERTKENIKYCEECIKADTYIQKGILVSSYTPPNQQPTRIEDKRFWK